MFKQKIAGFFPVHPGVKIFVCKDHVKTGKRLGLGRREWWKKEGILHWATMGFEAGTFNRVLTPS
jgi:hypothetical protein